MGVASQLFLNKHSEQRLIVFSQRETKGTGVDFFIRAISSSPETILLRYFVPALFFEFPILWIGRRAWDRVQPESGR